MFGTQEKRPVQYELDLRPWTWVQLELDLEYLPQPEPEAGENVITSDVGIWGDTSFIAAGSLKPTLHLNTGGSDEPTRSRLIVAPELVINMPRKRPNALVRFFHKHLLNFTWEKV